MTASKRDSAGSALDGLSELSLNSEVGGTSLRVDVVSDMSADVSHVLRCRAPAARYRGIVDGGEVARQHPKRPRLAGHGPLRRQPGAEGERTRLAEAWRAFVVSGGGGGKAAPMALRKRATKRARAPIVDGPPSEEHARFVLKSASGSKFGVLHSSSRRQVRSADRRQDSRRPRLTFPSISASVALVSSAQRSHPTEYWRLVSTDSFASHRAAFTE